MKRYRLLYSIRYSVTKVRNNRLETVHYRKQFKGFFQAVKFSFMLERLPQVSNVKLD